MRVLEDCSEVGGVGAMILNGTIPGARIDPQGTERDEGDTLQGLSPAMN